jgi:hypothetical protein
MIGMEVAQGDVSNRAAVDLPYQLEQSLSPLRSEMGVKNKHRLFEENNTRVADIATVGTDYVRVDAFRKLLEIRRQGAADSVVRQQQARR